MTCHTIEQPRTLAQILADIRDCQEGIRNASDAESVRNLRAVLRELTWQETCALDTAERERIALAYPVVLKD